MLLVAIAFGASLQNSFVWDDVVLIVNNPNINLQWKEIPSVITTPMWKLAGSDGLQVYYRPIPLLLTVLNYKIWGLNPTGFHFTHIIFHLVNTIILYRIGLLLFGNDKLIPLIAASIFAVHPTQTEPVCAASSGEVIYGLLIILSIFFFLKEKKYHSWFMFLLALLSKESSVMLPFALITFSTHKKGIKKGMIEILPYIGLVGAYLILRAMIVDTVLGYKVLQPLFTRLLTMAVATLDYIRLLLVPYPLSPYYPARWYTSIFDPKVLTAVVVLTLISYLAFKVRKDKTMLFLLSFPFIMLAPAILNVNAFPMGNYDRMYIAERFLYVPAMSYSLLISAFAVKLSDRIKRNYLITGWISIIIIFSAISVSSSMIWENNITLFERIIEKAPNAIGAYNELGNAYMRQGRYRDALVEYQTALKLKPDYAEAYYNIGIAYSESEMYKEAIGAYRQVIKIKPDHVNAYYGIGVIYGESRMYKEAIEAYKQALRLKPDHANVYYNLGVNYGRLGMHKEAIEAYKQSIRIKPDLADVHLNLAVAYLSLKDRDSALKEYKILKDLSPALANKLFNSIYKK
jgi:tetratricopeptide (TPR) repeat protein